MDLLSDILSKMQLSGTLYFRTSFTSPWSIKVPSFKNVSRFHFAHKGRCLVRVAKEAPPVLLEQGDLIIITRGATHTLYCDPTTEHQAIHLDDVVKKSGFTGKGALVYGELGTDHETQLICGHFAFEENANHLLLDALPAYIHIKQYGEAAGSWMEQTLKVIGSEAGRDQMGSSLIALKMSEIIFAQALRTHINTQANDQPVLAGFADPKILRVLSAIHNDPSENWTLESLATIAGMSRTSFANRFSQTMTVPPLNYITQWRMNVARQQLATTNKAIIEIAEKVGYHSEAAFSRVFKKHYQKAPATYRREVRMPA